MDSNISQQIQELQNLEQTAQSFLMQKQTVQLELNEVSNALEELSKSEDEVYKILSGLMIKSKKADLEVELKEKSKILELRIKSIEKQEVPITQKIEDLKSSLSKSMQKS